MPAQKEVLPVTGTDESYIINHVDRPQVSMLRRDKDEVRQLSASHGRLGQRKDDFLGLSREKMQKSVPLLPPISRTGTPGSPYPSRSPVVTPRHGTPYGSLGSSPDYSPRLSRSRSNPLPPLQVVGSDPGLETLSPAIVTTPQASPKPSKRVTINAGVPMGSSTFEQALTELADEELAEDAQNIVGSADLDAVVSKLVLTESPDFIEEETAEEIEQENADTRVSSKIISDYPPVTPDTPSSPAVRRRGRLVVTKGPRPKSLDDSDLNGNVPEKKATKSPPRSLTPSRGSIGPLTPKTQRRFRVQFHENTNRAAVSTSGESPVPPRTPSNSLRQMNEVVTMINQAVLHSGNVSHRRLASNPRLAALRKGEPHLSSNPELSLQEAKKARWVRRRESKTESLSDLDIRSLVRKSSD
ncbi:Hypp7134 [Branchiostoma lanceolatum]|uniref:Hypp7134 protein n=1 Tax=Branchiostoma lanceolatum TaxID=7740 RepID=A0A8K0ECE6_BRALA|nr:Hypp7134 [Branchiostoma lanceolatum]